MLKFIHPIKAIKIIRNAGAAGRDRLNATFYTHSADQLDTCDVSKLSGAKAFFDVLREHGYRVVKIDAETLATWEDEEIVQFMDGTDADWDVDETFRGR